MSGYFLFPAYLTDQIQRIFDTMLADGMPKSKASYQNPLFDFLLTRNIQVYFNFKQHQVSTASYLRDWIISLFLDHLPFEACARIWDVILLEGDSFLYRASLGILAVLEPRLFFPDRRELLELLKYVVKYPSFLSLFAKTIC